MSNEINCKQKNLKKLKSFFLPTDKSRANKNYRSQENDRLIYARMQQIRTETKTHKTKRLVLDF